MSKIRLAAIQSERVAQASEDRERYKIEPFLNVPDIVSPVAMEFDENGDLYVVEDRGYPLNVNGKVGCIKLLRDTNTDGVPDKVTVFADKLVMPTGVMRWKKESWLRTLRIYFIWKTRTTTVSRTCAR